MDSTQKVCANKLFFLNKQKNEEEWEENDNEFSMLVDNDENEEEGWKLKWLKTIKTGETKQK